MPEDFYMQWSRKLLKPMAVPSIFSFAPPAKKRKAPLERTSYTYSQIVSCTSDSYSDDTNYLVKPSVSFLPAHDHTYGVKSPTKLKATVDILVEKLSEKSNLLRNAVRREKTLTTNVADLVQQLREQKI